MKRFIIRTNGDWVVVDNVTEIRIMCESLNQAIEIAYTY